MHKFLRAIGFSKLTKDYLKNTDRSILDISTFLGFSSQAYFQNVFKKIMGVTPGVYRNAKKVPPFMQNDH